ncbi:MAG: threonine--tRNA ligase, partial [Patescibacteria group bacterium]
IEKIRHSLAHLMAMAVLEKYPKTKFGIGPTIENGFYYDFGNIKLIDADLPVIEKRICELIKQNLQFKKEIISPIAVKKIFKNQSYKLELIKDIQKTKKPISIYKSGDFIDLCAGPHIKSTSEINPEAFKLTKIAGAYWKGSEKNPMLTRIYGIAFDNKNELNEYLILQEETEKRDHKKLGLQLGLFMFHETAPGMPYWLPKGLIIYNELINFWREEHKIMNYEEIASPLINKADLWKISGHWDHYKDDMFIANMGKNEIYGVKPMNCPNAMIVFASRQISYKDLPLRLSDVDRLHRYERSGTLNGLLRARSFQQDDSHNFITENMIGSEYEHIFELCKKFYGIFNLEYSFRLGTRPDKFLGEIKIWDKAESILKEILKKSGKKYFIAEGDGAFYGPKIDIIMKDSLGRDWQMGTMQLDFQLPQRFNLEYIDKDGQKKCPVVIHRVIYGSLERFIGILIEHTAGNLPLWLSPIQVKILPISEKQNDYAGKIFNQINEAHIRVKLDNNNESLSKKIREAKLQKIPYLIIIGEKEVTENLITIESRNKTSTKIDISSFITKLKEEIRQKK